MFISKISLTKSKTFGSQLNSGQMKFNKVVVSMDADLTNTVETQGQYQALSAEVDKALEFEINKLKSGSNKPINI